MPVVAAEGAVGIEKQSAFELARIPGGRRVLVELLEIITWRGSEAQLVADEIVEDGAGVAADGPMRLIGDDEIEIGGREERLILVVE